MELDPILAQICAGPERTADLAAAQAEALFEAMLAGRVAAFELGAALTALRWKRESVEELAGFLQAAARHLRTLELPPGTPRCVVIPSYSRSCRQPNLMPLLATMLARFGVPVLVHGSHGAASPIPSFEVFRRLGFAPVERFEAIADELTLRNLALVPTRLLSPELDALLALRERLGMRNSAFLVAKFLDPCPGRSLRLACISDPELLERLRRFAPNSPGRMLLMQATEGEAYADPLRRPRIEMFDDGRGEVLFEREARTIPPTQEVALDLTPAETAALITRMLDGDRTTPQPLLNQLAACLFASAHTADLPRAKALVALGMPMAANG